MFRHFFLFFLIPFFAVSQQKKKVLFIGNSYTLYNSLPQMIADIALSNQDTVIFDQSIFGGYTFNLHCNTAQTWQKIRSNNWDVVVLQAQSQEPSLSPTLVYTNTLPYAKQLNDSVKAINPCTEVMFFMTWGRKNGDAANCNAYPPVCSYNGMQARLRDSYLMFKDSCKATCVPVGVAWKKVITLYPLIELYQQDESHPSIHGSYLAACVFYSSIFKKSCVGVSYPSFITSMEAFNIQSVASPTVLDSIKVWNLGSNKPSADFSFSYLGNNSFQFTNLSMNASGYNWSFGSTIPSPAYQFTTDPPHQIKLKVYNNCTTDSIEKLVVPSGIVDNDGTNQHLKIMMTDDENYMVTGINIDGVSIQIFSTGGQWIKTIDLQRSAGLIEVKGIAPGIYMAVFIKSDVQISKQKLLIR